MPMQQYEIRVLRPDLSTAHIIEVIYENDRMAVRAGREMAEGELFEVWRDLECLHRANGGALPH